jgi:hypothetical protein
MWPALAKPGREPPEGVTRQETGRNQQYLSDLIVMDHSAGKCDVIRRSVNLDRSGQALMVKIFDAALVGIAVAPDDLSRQFGDDLDVRGVSTGVLADCARQLNQCSGLGARLGTMRLSAYQPAPPEAGGEERSHSIDSHRDVFWIPCIQESPGPGHISETRCVRVDRSGRSPDFQTLQHLW